MSGPQGYDPTQPWQPQQPGQGDQPAETQWTSTPGYAPSQYPEYPQQPTSYPAAPQYPATPGYGQPDQYGQQYGQPGTYGQYGQYGQYPQPAPYGQPPSGGRSKAVVILAAIAGLAAALVLVLGFFKPGFFVTTKLDIDKAQAGVQQILSDETNGYGAKNVKDVTCNDGVSPVVKKNDTFDCEVSIDGTKRRVTVTFKDDSGTYEVGRPN